MKGLCRCGLSQGCFVLWRIKCALDFGLKNAELNPIDGFSKNILFFFKIYLTYKSL